MDGIFEMEVAPKHCIEIRSSHSSVMLLIMLLKYNIPLALLSAVRALADGVNAEFSFMMIKHRTGWFIGKPLRGITELSVHALMFYYCDEERLGCM